MKLRLFGAAMVLSIASILDIEPKGVHAVAISTQDDLPLYNAAQTFTEEDKKVEKKHLKAARKEVA